MTDRALDAVLFDFGGVLGSSPTPAMRRRMDEYGLTPDQFLPIALGPLHEDGDHPWHRAERGEIDLAGFVAEVEPIWRAAGFDAFPSPPDAAELAAALQPIPEMVAVAREARAAGYRTAIVSNMIVDWGSWRSTIDADDLVDVVIDSSQVGFRKPDPTIYRLAVDRLGVAAERAVFVDDFAWNLPAAAGLGMTTIHATDPLAAATELRALLGLG
jgi:epoxide hydrolase-like predicted phosphatase